MKKLFLFGLIIAFSVSAPLFANKKFTNSYIEFSLPDTWFCKEEGGQHVCQPNNPEQRKEAIIVMASKFKGPEDELKNYMTRLNEKREVKDIKGKAYTSKNQYTKWNTILGNVWIDSQHLSSEVPGFVTRYLATVQKGLGIVVTFSAHESKFAQYSADFYQMINSLRVRDNIPAAPSEKGDMTKLGSGVIIGGEMGKKAGEKKPGGAVQIAFSKQSDSTMIIAGAAVVALLLLFIIIRRRRRRK